MTTPQETEKVKESPAPQVPPRSNRKPRLRILMLIILLAVAATSGYWWFFMRYRVKTDNAYVMADNARISSRVPGTVQAVMVENDQAVNKEQVLMELDPRDYRVAMDRAEAAVARIEAEMKAAEVNISVTDAQTQAEIEVTRAEVAREKDNERSKIHDVEELERKRAAAQAELADLRRDLKRYETLFSRGAGSEQARDHVKTSFKKAKANLQAIEAEISSVQASMAAARQDVVGAEAKLQMALSNRGQVVILKHRLEALKAALGEARAQLEQARLNLSYCTIKAPLAGYISQKSVQVGERVSTGQPLMAIVPLQDVYVEANFKETQLEHVRLGHHVVIRADTYPDFEYHGKVIGIRAGTGAAFSLLPPENATGNWIKVVQRVPVKIKLDAPPPPDRPLRIGLSLHVTIDTRDRTGGTLLAAPNQ